MHLITKNKMKIKYIRYFTIFFLTILSLSNVNSNALEIDKKVYAGNKDAKVTVKVFSSLTCPYCADFHKNIFIKLKKEFIDSNYVRFEHHSFPLDLAALNAEKILRCVTDHKKRIALLDEIYEKQEEWASGNDINNINSKLSKIAKKYDLNDDRIKNCLVDENLENEILEIRINGSKKYSIQSTPTIFINEKKYDGKHDYNLFKKEIEKLL
jgi:Protein-disulfide isomerase